MKTRTHISIAAVVCGLFFTSPSGFAQGSLTPPGAPAPSMKSLSQVEPRTPISSAPFTISASGSYYLTTNISVTSGSAITITASQVTLDLNGFTLSSTETTPTGTGILLASGNTDITILNGHIKGSVTYSGGVYSGPGFANGIYYSVSPPFNVRVSGVSVSGCSTYGIYLSVGNATIVESCPVFDIGSYGIEANGVSKSSASQCGSVAIAANIASDCYGFSTGSLGVYAYFSANNCYGQTASSSPGLSATTANNCQGQNNGSGNGLNAVTANNCQGQCTGSGTGLYAHQAATGCYGICTGGGTGLSATTAFNCTGQSTGNGDGLDAGTANNCQGQAAGGGTGLSASQTAMGCYGVGFIGLQASYANNCSGLSKSGGGAGLSAINATGCYGECYPGWGLYLQNANFCFGTSIALNAPGGNKYNMP
jgi:hypothetical protein